MSGAEAASTRRTAQGSVQITLRRDALVALELVQIQDFRIRLLVWRTAADLARRAAIPHFSFQLENFRNVVARKTSARLWEQIEVLPGSGT